MNFEFMTIDTPLPPCMPFPRALTGFPVSSTAKVMYCRMLDAMLSKGKEDENGILFVCFPITAMTYPARSGLAWAIPSSCVLRFSKREALQNPYSARIKGVQMKKYKIIYADPPWRYARSKVQGAAEKHYPTMSIEELCALPVKEIADKDCILFLWATFPQLKEALQLIKAWGFTYKSVAFVWLKQNRKSPTWFYGLGFWTRGNAEICLLATKGHPKRQSNKPQLQRGRHAHSLKERFYPFLLRVDYVLLLQVH